MTLKEKLNMGEVSAYETPSLKTLEVQSEGVLCGSYKWTEGGGGIYEDGDINDNGEY